MAWNQSPERPGETPGCGAGRYDHGVRGVARHIGVRGRTRRLRIGLADHQGQAALHRAKFQGQHLMPKLAEASLIEAADSVSRGKATSLELLQACWANLDALNPLVNAVIWEERAQAEAAARAADEKVAKGER